MMPDVYSVADSTNAYTKTETRWCMGDGLSQ